MKRLRGFTLFELVLAIGILMSLSVLAFSALNPIQRLQEARNARRWKEVRTLLQAVKDSQIRQAGGPVVEGVDDQLRMIGTAPSGCRVVCGERRLFTTQIVGTNNDAEEKQLSRRRYMYLTSTDLELTFESGTTPQWVGMRFTNITIPRRSAIATAFIEFTVDEIDTVPTSVSFYGQASDNPSVFTLVDGNISSRPRTPAAVAWNNIPPWNRVGVTHRTPNLAPILQEIVNRPGWTPGNAVVVLVDGTGERTAEAYDGVPRLAPKLIVEYDGETTQEACLNLTDALSETLPRLPVDPREGSQERTYYAIKAVEPGGLKVMACKAEDGQAIEVME